MLIVNIGKKMITKKQDNEFVLFLVYDDVVVAALPARLPPVALAVVAVLVVAPAATLDR